MRVVLAHDYLTQLGGAERVALSFTKIFKGAPLYTAVYAGDQTFSGFREVDVRPSFLQQVGWAKSDPRLALPLLPAAWDRFPAVEADVVVASSSGWAHGMPVAPGTRKVVYCHNPPRWLYQGDDYLTTPAQRLAVGVLRKRLRRWDLRAAATATTYLANSSVVAERIRTAYGLRPVVLHPPVTVDVDGDEEPVPGLEPGFWLTISRGRAYKNTHQLIDGVTHLARQRLVVVGSTPEQLGENPNPLLTAVGRVSDATLRWLYRNCRGIVTIAHEDFGLTPIEANAFGKPAVVLRAGGFLDSVAPGISGAWIHEATAESVAEALSRLPSFDDGAIRRHAEKFSPENFARRLKAFVREPVGSASR